MDRPFHGFEIESTSHCQSGYSPRWSWWIRGIAGTQRYGVVGTDESGLGLYLYSYTTQRTQTREQLLPPERFTLVDDMPRAQANERVSSALAELGWHPAGALRV